MSPSKLRQVTKVAGSKLLQVEEACFERPATVLILAAIPNPFFDITGIAAGVLKMNVKVYFIWALLGNIIKMLILTLAASGLFSLPFLHNIL